MDLNSNEWRSKLNYTRRKWHVKEDVVISGMSGRFPKSENVQEFAENLFNGVDMVTSGNDRFPSVKLWKECFRLLRIPQSFLPS